MRRTHPFGIDAERREHLVTNEVGIDENGLRAVDGPRKTPLEPAHPVGGMRIRKTHPRKIVDRDHNWYVIGERHIVLLVIQLYAMSSQAAGEPEMVRVLSNRATQRNERLDAVCETRFAW